LYKSNKMTASIIILTIIIIFSLFCLKTNSTIFFNLLPKCIFQFWRFFTYGFVHNSYSHLFSNVIIYSIGFLGLFQKFDNIQFLTFYFSSLMISSIPFILSNLNNKVSLSGCSGVTNSILYCFFASNPFTGYEIITYAIGILFFIHNIRISQKNKNISFSSHITGTIFGLSYYYLLLV
jgi:membrane associated rhomboid family serine protease